MKIYLEFSFAIGIVLNVGFIIVEVTFGLLVNSLALIADAGISFGVVIVGLVLTFTSFYWLDPVVSIIIALIIFWGTWNLLKDSTSLALEAVPKEIDIAGVEKYLTSLQEVESVHHLHIWAMSTTETALTIHATIQIEDPGDPDCKQNHI
ncbi:MAG: cation transporter [Spirochaetia bacterium]|nr:cation transporter [Spirochaetia bacterium]